MSKPRRYTRTLWSEVASSLRGPDRTRVLAVFILLFALVVLAVLALIGFFRADGTREQIFFGVLFLFFTQTIGHLKMWYWSRLDRYAILEELEHRLGA